MAAAGGLEEFIRTLKDKRRLAMLAASGVLIAINWTFYVVAVVNDHVLETSLGYFINPLLNVVLAVVVLREHLPVAGRIDVALARSEEHTSELQSLMRISYAVFCLKKKIETYTDNQ